MYVFYHSKQTVENKNYYKGVLFEKLLSEYLKNLGYRITIRSKHNSLEYDLEGKHIPTEQKMVGEAKAYEKNIAGQILAAFVGKVLPLGLQSKEIKGVFLSTSPLTSEAEDYFRTIKDFGITVFSGKQLYQSLFEIMKYPNPENLRILLDKEGFIVQAEYLLSTDTGIFIAFVSGNSDTVAPTYLSIFGQNGSIITDQIFIKTIINECAEFTSLIPLTLSKNEEKQVENRTINSGLVVGSSWIDYRLPAGPEYFIGRDTIISEVIKEINGSAETSILQIKSRSGVGKSSTLSMIADHLIKAGFNIELHDARDIKSVIDLRAVIKRFTKANEMPQDLREVEDCFSNFGSSIFPQKAILMVDQFESTFTNVEIFNLYENIAQLILKYRKNIYMIIARKNDQLTTYDESKITLNRLNEISHSYVLQDFTISEATQLIKKINETSSISVGTDILSYVLEFAQGFPWLLKRTMAHLVKLVTQYKIPQDELFAVGLKLDDLFDEELDGLDEIEKEYLFRIASKLPSDFNQLQRSFDEDPLLIRVLDKLTQMRLLRMTGATYDTYNDVFKEYLVYKRLPEFKQSILYRSYPNRTISSYLSIIDKASFTNQDLEDLLGLKSGSIFNSIREWRNFGLVEKDGDSWNIPKKIIDIYNKVQFGEYIRRQLIENDIVSKFITKVSNSSFHEDKLSTFLKEQFSFVEATNQTWQLYANIMKSWLVGTKIISIDSNGIFGTIIINREDVISQLGNLDSYKIGIRKNSNLFLPSASWQYIDEIVIDLIKGTTPQKGEKLKALNDLKNLGLVDNSRLKFNNREEIVAKITDILKSDPYSNIWNATRTQEPLLPIMYEMLSIDISEETIKWRLKKLLNWGKGLGFIQDRRYRY